MRKSCKHFSVRRFSHDKRRRLIEKKSHKTTPLGRRERVTMSHVKAIKERDSEAEVQQQVDLRVK